MISLDILYEDDVLVVVNKPPSLLVTPDRWDQGIPTLQDMLREYLRRKSPGEHPNIRIVHRLDKDTSGAMVLAKNVKAQAYLSAQFEKGEVNKTYYAIVKGVIEKDEGMINLGIIEHVRKPGMMAIHSKGKKSISLYKVLERFQDFTFVEVNPLTGRTHQVRLHLQAIGHPLAIDPLYGSSEPIYLSSLKKDYKEKGSSEKPVISRQPLHSFRLTFREPAEEKLVVVEAPLPKDFSYMLKSLRKYHPARPAVPAE